VLDQGMIDNGYAFHGEISFIGAIKTSQRRIMISNPC